MKRRSKVLLIMFSVILGALVIDIIVDWSSFKEGYRKGRAAAGGK